MTPSTVVVRRGGADTGKLVVVLVVAVNGMLSASYDPTAYGARLGFWHRDFMVWKTMEGSSYCIGLITDDAVSMG